MSVEGNIERTCGKEGFVLVKEMGTENPRDELLTQVWESTPHCLDSVQSKKLQGTHLFSVPFAASPLCSLYPAWVFRCPHGERCLWHCCSACSRVAGAVHVLQGSAYCKASSVPVWQEGKGYGSAHKMAWFGVKPGSKSLTCRAWSHVCYLGKVCYEAPSCSAPRALTGVLI